MLRIRAIDAPADSCSDSMTLIGFSMSPKGAGGFKIPAKPGRYPFVCTFSGHFASGMVGTIVVR